MRHLILTVMLLCCWSTVALAQQPKPDSSEMLKQLLALPAPTPRIIDSPPAEPNQPTREEPVQKVTAPADDASIEELQQYWNRWKRTPYKDEPSSTIKQRLVEAFAADPKNLQTLLPFLTPAEGESMKAVFDKLPNDPDNKNHRDKIRAWLVNNSKYFLNELLAQANKVHDNTEAGNVQNSSELTTLAKVDWSTAEPLLKSLAETGQPRSSTLAISLLYKHAAESGNGSAEDKFRTQLQTIAGNRNFPGMARNTAIEALSVTNWSGRDDWYLTLMQDESLITLDDGVYGFRPLNTIFLSDPDKWIPIMTKLVGGTNRSVQQCTASCLVRYVIQSPRRDAILPVLRWLSEPDWLPISDNERAWFMQKMNQVEVPESVPGLIWIIENEKMYAKWAARTIAHYKDPRAIPALKRALSQNEEDDRTMILDSLLASGGLTDAEVIDALEQYAAKLLTPEGRNEVEKYYYPSGSALPVPLSIGRYLATRREVPPEIVRVVLSHATRLRKQNPELSHSLMHIAEQWQSREVDLNVIGQIAAGTADAGTIANALTRRKELRESLATELPLLLSAGGVAPAVGSIMLDDSALAQAILSSGDQPAQIAVLASARLTQTPLPVAVVGQLLQSKNWLLAHAAESYLLVEDSGEAQALLWQRHPGEAFITGWRQNIQLLTANNFDALGKKEERLRGELFKENGPVEIFALVNNIVAYYDQVLRVYNDRAVYTNYEDPARYRERVISKRELSAFKQFLATENLEALGPQIRSCHHDCSVTELVLLRKERGRRVFSHQPFFEWQSLLEQLDRLNSGPNVKYHYHLESEIKGLELLYTGEKVMVRDVWQHGDEIRVFTERTASEAEVEEQKRTEASDADGGTARRANFQQSLFAWRKFAGGKLAEVTDEPDVYAMYDASSRPAPDETQSAKFAPLLQEGKRFLQATGKADEFWAAIPDEEKDQTRVGRYNLKTFSFTPVLTVPHIRFDSMSMWIDEKRGKIYVAYEGQLISIPLPGLHAAVSGD